MKYSCVSLIIGNMLQEIPTAFLMDTVYQVISALEET